MKSVYLCGPITGSSYNDVTDWRKFVAIYLAHDIIPISPMRGKEFLNKEKQIGYSYKDDPMTTSQAITIRDRFDVMNCDALFANFLGTNKISIGSMIELGWADAFRKPIIFVGEKDNIHHHPIVDNISAFCVSNIQDGIDIVNVLLSKDFAKKSQ